MRQDLQDLLDFFRLRQRTDGGWKTALLEWGTTERFDLICHLFVHRPSSLVLRLPLIPFSFKPSREHRICDFGLPCRPKALLSWKSCWSCLNFICGLDSILFIFPPIVNTNLAWIDASNLQRRRPYLTIFRHRHTQNDTDKRIKFYTTLGSDMVLSNHLFLIFVIFSPRSGPHLFVCVPLCASVAKLCISSLYDPFLPMEYAG
jgi:hypothetical protein